MALIEVQGDSVEHLSFSEAVRCRLLTKMCSLYQSVPMSCVSSEILPTHLPACLYLSFCLCVSLFRWIVSKMRSVH